MRKEAYKIRINKLNKLFNIRGNCKIVNKRINDMLNDKAKRNPNFDTNIANEFADKTFAKVDDLIYYLEIFSKQYEQLTPFKLYKIFVSCLDALNELEFFNDTIGNIKDYDGRKIRDSIDKVRIFIPTLRDEQIRIPQNRNDVYNEIYWMLIEDYKVSEKDVLNILSVVYEKPKKAKLPNITRAWRKEFKEILYHIAKGLGKQNGLSDDEIKRKIEEIDIRHKNR